MKNTEIILAFEIAVKNHLLATKNPDLDTSYYKKVLETERAKLINKLK